MRTFRRSAFKCRPTVFTVVCLFGCEQNNSNVDDHEVCGMGVDLRWTREELIEMWKVTVYTSVRCYS